MSKSNETARVLSWRRLHLAKAKLKLSSKTSALLSGFAMVAMVELQLEGVREGLLIAFAVCTTLLVAIHLLALMISTCILPDVEAISNDPYTADVLESPHEKMHLYIEAAWSFSTVFGLILFLLEIIILGWVKFYEQSVPSASAVTIVLIPFLIIFVAFAVHFYRKLVSHKYEQSERGLRELESMANQLQNDGTGILAANGPPVLPV